MKAVLLLCILAVAMVAANELETEVDADRRKGKKANCHPTCRWQCDDPSCPAVCHPVCARPKCEMQCQQTECAKCTVHCEQPECSVRCPKDMCEKDSCPKCETVCAPAQCHTTCVAPKANCAPLCEETSCSWSCAKPTTCPRPKCELQCSKPACDVKDKQKCCKCGAKGAKRAIAAAARFEEVHGDAEMQPSFMEVVASFKHAAQEGVEECCPCKNKK